MKKFICLCLCFILLSSSILCGRFINKAHADALTTSMVGSAAVALMSDWGITFSSINADASNMQNLFDTRIDEYVTSHGGSLQALFGYEVARSVAGKLVVGYQLYNGVIDFIDYVQEKYNDVLSYGNYGENAIPSHNPDASVDINPNGVSVLCSNYYKDSAISGFSNVKIYNKSSLLYSNTSDPYYYCYTGAWDLLPDNDKIICRVFFVRRSGESSFAQVVVGSISALNNKLSYNDSSYVKPTVLNPDKEWSGTIGGQAIPDTNLDQLIDQIFEDVADNNLDVDGEVIDIPIPPPTPVPIDPDTPLSDVPWEGLDNNLTDLYNQGLEEIGAIGEAQDAITDAVSEQTGALEGAIAGNAGVVSGAIDQAVSDIQDAISEQTQTLSESVSATAEATESITEALEDEAIDWKKFDLRGLFPFCIPFDIYNMLEALDASPTAPHVKLPFVIESIGFSYTIDLDFSAFDQVAAVMRTMELIVYGIALAWATSKVIKW